MANELDGLKYEIYKKSGKKDYITFKQFKNNEEVAYTFGELKRKKIRKSLDNGEQKDINK